MPRRKTGFFFSAFSSREAGAPVGIPAVNTPVLRAGYRVRVFDSTVTSRFQQPNFVDVAVKGQRAAFPPPNPNVNGPQLSAEATSC